MTKSIWYFLVVAAGLCRCWGGDQAQWGEAWSRNMVSTETNLPADFSPKSGKNIKWAAELGTETYSTPIVAGHRVYIGTNNQNPRDPAHLSDCGVLMCFDEHSGKFLWQLAVPKREEDPYHDWPKTGMPSPVTVESNYVYLVSNRGEVMCLDAEGMTNGNGGSYRDEAAHMIPRTTNSIAKIVSEVGPADADILWLTDLTKQAGIWSHDGAHSSILINGEHLYLNSGTGVDNTHKVIRSSNAPSLLVLNKRTGEIIARDREHIAPDIFHCTWSSPSLGKVDGKNMLFFGAGNGHLYSFETLPAGYNKGPGTDSIALKKIWSIDFDPAAPKQDIHKYLSNRREGPSNFYGMPVFLNGRIYVAAGGDLWWGKNQAWLKCYDAAKGELGIKRKSGLVPWSATSLVHPPFIGIWCSLLIVAAECIASMRSTVNLFGPTS